MPEPKWPQLLWIVRHGQSAGNVAREVAEAAAKPLIEVATRDVDTPLSPLGEQQAMALGRWFGAMPRECQSSVALCSPYARALQTTQLVLCAAGIDCELLERMSEAQILSIDRAADVPNCSVTSYEFDRRAGRVGKLVPRLVNFVAPIEEAGAPATSDPDVPAAPKP